MWVMVVFVVSSSQERAGTSGLTPTGLTEVDAEASKNAVGVQQERRVGLDEIGARSI
jgi:hypothetical protein